MKTTLEWISHFTKNGSNVFCMCWSAFRSSPKFLHAILLLASRSMATQLWPRSFNSFSADLSYAVLGSTSSLLSFKCPKGCGSCDGVTSFRSPCLINLQRLLVTNVRLSPFLAALVEEFLVGEFIFLLKVYLYIFRRRKITNKELLDQSNQRGRQAHYFEKKT